MNAMQVLEIIGAAIVLSAALCIALAVAYDVRRNIYAPRLPVIMPTVTVIVRDVVDVSAVEQLMNYLKKSTHQNPDVVLIMGRHASHTTKSQVRAAAKQSSGAAAVYAPHAGYSIGEVLHRAYGKSGRGEMVLCIESKQVDAVELICPAANQLSRESPQTGALLFADRIATPTTFAELSITCMQLSRMVVVKALVCARLLRVSHHATALYRREAFVSATRKGRVQRATYDSSLLVKGTKHLDSDIVRVVGSVAGAALVVYTMYSSILAAALVDAQPLLLGWAVAVAWLAVAIWLNDAITLRARLVLSAMLPISYFAIVATMIVVGLNRTVVGKSIK